MKDEKIMVKNNIWQKKMGDEGREGGVEDDGDGHHNVFGLLLKKLSFFIRKPLFFAFHIKKYHTDLSRPMSHHLRRHHITQDPHVSHQYGPTPKFSYCCSSVKQFIMFIYIVIFLSSASL